MSKLITCILVILIINWSFTVYMGYILSLSTMYTVRRYASWSTLISGVVLLITIEKWWNPSRDMSLIIVAKLTHSIVSLVALASKTICPSRTVKSWPSIAIQWDQVNMWLITDNSLKLRDYTLHKTNLAFQECMAQLWDWHWLHRPDPLKAHWSAEGRLPVPPLQ